MNLEGIMLNEISRKVKGEYHMISLTFGIFKKNKLIEKEIRLCLPEVGVREGGIGGRWSKGTNF